MTNRVAFLSVLAGLLTSAAAQAAGYRASKR